jgi:hypothetical protein
MESGFAEAVTNKCTKFKWTQTQETPVITQKIINKYNGCLKNKFKKYAGQRKFKSCRGISHLELDLYTKKDVEEICVNTDFSRFSVSGELKILNSVRPVHPGAVCLKEVQKSKPAWNTWNPPRNNEKAAAKSDQGKAFNKCYNDAINKWVNKSGNKLCKRATLNKILNDRSNYKIFNVANCLKEGKDLVKLYTDRFTTFDDEMTVYANKIRAERYLNLIYGEGSNTVRAGIQIKCGVKFNPKRPKLSSKFNFELCQKNATKALNNYVYGCQHHAVSFKTLEDQQKANNACIRAGYAVYNSWNDTKCGNNGKSGKESNALKFNLREFRRRGTEKVKISVKPTKNSVKHWNLDFISHLSKRQFQRQCVIFAGDVNHSSNEEEYKKIIAALETFQTAYQKTHPKSECRKPNTWAWVSTHHVDEHSDILTASESAWINSNMEAAEPKGIDRSHSSVVESEYTECIVGKSNAETVAFFNKSANWWLRRIRSCKTPADYFHARHEYYHLIQVYEEHNYHVRASAPACPSWSEVTAE